MQSLTQYDDVVRDVSESLKRRSEKAEEAGIARWMQILDPGIGFAKDGEQNIELLKRSGEIVAAVAPTPLLVGVSRKGFIGKLMVSPSPSLSSSSSKGRGGEKSKTAAIPPPAERDYGSVAASLKAIEGGARIVRVHNVKAMRQAANVYDACSK
jgi:dihydropteroate synthase